MLPAAAALAFSLGLLLLAAGPPPYPLITENPWTVALVALVLIAITCAVIEEIARKAGRFSPFLVRFKSS